MLFFLGCSIDLSAQFSLGAKLGMNLSKIGVNENVYAGCFKFKPGLNIGAFAEYKFYKSFTAVAGLNFDQRGATYKEEGADPMVTYNEKVRVTANYLQILLMARYYYEIINSVTLYGGIGPSVGLFMGGKAKGTVEYGNNKDDINKNLKTYTKRASLALAFAIGVQTVLCNYDTFFEFSYKHGLTTDGKNNVPLSHNLNAKSRVLTFGVGVKGLFSRKVANLEKSINIQGTGN